MADDSSSFAQDLVIKPPVDWKEEKIYPFSQWNRAFGSQNWWEKKRKLKKL